jgi:hypothetical protein
VTFLAASPRESRQAQQLTTLAPATPDEPGLLEGAGTATAVGVGRVAAVASQLAGFAEYQVGSMLTRPIDDLFDTELTERLDEITRKGPARLTASMIPNPETTGAAGQVLYSLAAVGIPAAVGGVLGGPGGAALAAGAFTGTGTAADLTAQGVDFGTAMQAAAVDAGLTAAGVALPASVGGSLLLNTLLFGPGVNVAQDIAAQKGIGEVLRTAGYGQLADRYSQIHGEMIVADVILGAAFGYAGARGYRPGTAAVDSALVAAERKHIELDTAPGIPADHAAVNTHVARLNAATESLLAGEPVAVDDVGQGGRFVPRDAVTDDDAVVISALRDSGLPGILDEVAALERDLAARGRVVEPDDLTVEPDLTTRFATQLAEYETARSEYAALPETKGGKVISVDEARELSPDYREDRSRSAEVHEPASALAKRMYADRLKLTPEEAGGEVVMFTAGGTGAGKTTALRDAGFDVDSPHTVYDTNMNGYESSKTKIEQALAAGRPVEIVFVYRDPLESLTGGALPRAERMGRTVTAEAHAETHNNALPSVIRLAEDYKVDPRVRFTVVDNSLGKGNAKLSTLAEIAPKHYTVSTEEIRNVTEAEFEAGRIGEKTRSGTRGISQADRPGNGRRAEQGRDAGQVALTQALDQNPDLQIATEDGTVRAADAATRADEAVTRANDDAQAFGAAVSCFIRGGDV